LYAIAANAKHHYRQWERVTTKGGVTKVRVIRAPSDELKAIQKQIVKRVFAEYELRIAHVKQYNPGNAQRLSRYLVRVVTALQARD